MEYEEVTCHGVVLDASATYTAGLMQPTSANPPDFPLPDLHFTWDVCGYPMGMKLTLLADLLALAKVGLSGNASIPLPDS